MGRRGKWRRRRPGIYLVRTRKHAGRTRENGYVGLSNNWERRRLEHLGQGRYGAAAKPWCDLDPRWHVLRLPWWLGFRWTLAPLEFVAIKVLLPRYNVTHNKMNPRQVTLGAQRIQRVQRDQGRVLGVARVLAWRPNWATVLGSIIILAGIIGTVATH